VLYTITITSINVDGTVTSEPTTLFFEVEGEYGCVYTYMCHISCVCVHMCRVLVITCVNIIA